MIKQFGGSGYESSEVMVIDEVELQMHHQLEKLYRSTRSGRVIISSMLNSVLGVISFFLISENFVNNLGIVLCR